MKRARVLAKTERRGWENDRDTLRRLYNRLVIEGPTPVFDEMVRTGRSRWDTLATLLPPGPEWSTFGTHAGPEPAPELEFSDEVNPEDGFPLFERPLSLELPPGRGRYPATMPDAGRMKPSSPPLDIRPRDA